MGQKKDPLPNSFLFTPDKLYPRSPPSPPPQTIQREILTPSPFLIYCIFLPANGWCTVCLLVKICFYMFSSFVLFFQNEVKISRPAFWCKLKKTCFFAKFSCKFLAFLSFFSKENAENDCLDQRLEYAAPKRWWKYTTHAFPLTLNVQDNWTKIIWLDASWLSKIKNVVPKTT